MGETEMGIAAERNTNARWLRILISYLIAGICLSWMLYHIHPEHLIIRIGNMKWPLVAIAIAVGSLVYVFQGLRWRLLLLPLVRIGVLDAIEAVYVGVFASEILPFRFGELARAYLLSRRYSQGMAEIVPSMVLERLFDGTWLALSMGLLTLFLPLTPDLVRGARLFGTAIIALIVLLLHTVLRGKKTVESQADNAPTAVQKLHRTMQLFVEVLTVGLRRIGFSFNFFLAAGISVISLALEAISLWLVMIAYGLPLTLWQGAAILLIVRIGTILPGAPANVGTYQFFVALGLEIFGIGRTTANNFSLVVFFLLSGSLWIIGFFAFSHSGIDFLRLRREATKAARGRW